MNKFALAAIGAAGMLVSLSLTPAPAAAAPMQSGIAASVLDGDGAVQKAWWGGCHRFGWGGGWGGWGWGWGRPHRWHRW